MKYSAAVIDTNVVVAGLLTASAESPTARILDGMRNGAFPFLLSTELLAEYRQVLLREKIRSLHGLSEQEVDLLLTVLAANAIVREPEARTGAPDAKDDHLWALLQSEAKTVLVTGDHALAKSPPPVSAVLAPREFAALLPA
jgi:putative PIN family toxin of toxin-antitoxin system